MSWVFERTTGKLFDPQGKLVEIGYSGNKYKDNPTIDNEKNIDPLPEGLYLIGPARVKNEGKGEYVMPLMPVKKNIMYGRGGFLIHADNRKMDKSASEGCPILSLPTRKLISASSDREFKVVQTCQTRS